MDNSDKSEEEEEHEMDELSVSFFKMGASAQDGTSHSQHDEQHQHNTSEEEDMVTHRLPAASATLKARRRGASFSCLSVAAIGANATLANTGLGNGLLGQEILPVLDSPKSFRPLEKSPSFSKIESLMSSQYSSCLPDAAGGASPSMPPRQTLETRSFLSATDALTAGGAAGEDRVQAVCSEQDGWLFCAIYDGFNGRDAADFLAGTLYENISHNLTQLVWQTQVQKQQNDGEHVEEEHQAMDIESVREDESGANDHHPQRDQYHQQEVPRAHHSHSQQRERIHQQQQHHVYAEEPSFRDGVLRALRKALMETEAGFMEMVQQDMEDRPDLVMVGSCVLVVLLYGNYLYTLSLGDSRAVLATTKSRRGEGGEAEEEEEEEGGGVGGGRGGGRGGAGQAQEEEERAALCWVQLTQDHVVAERSEMERVLAEHPDDPHPIVSDRVKGKIKLTRAFGAGYLKKTHLNEKLMGLLRVPNLSSPPYISAKPHLSARRLCRGDEFVVMGSDGLFDFFSNDEVISLLQRFLLLHPSADPARYLLDQLLLRAATSAGMTLERLKNIQIGRRRAYHDDVTIMVVTLGANHRTSSASTIS